MCAAKRKIKKKEGYSDEELELIREKQLELALNGDRQMLIWLGKTALGQKPAANRINGKSGDPPLELTRDEEYAVFGNGEEEV